MTRTLLTAAALAVLAVPAAAHAQETSWIHVRVDEEDGARVRVNLPVSLVDVAVDVAAEEGLEDGHLRLDEHGDVSVEELRRMWRELEGAGDAELVDVRDDGERVRVFRKDGRVHVHVDEDGEQRVRAVMPDEVAGALLGTEEETLDLRAALRELARSGTSGELVRVRDRDATVRVWIDDRSGQPEGETRP